MKPRKNKDKGAEKAAKNKLKAKNMKISKETVESLSDDELGDVAGGLNIAPKTGLCTAVCSARCLTNACSFGCEKK